MARVAAPKSSSYDARLPEINRRKSIKALRAKPVLTAVDKDALLALLMDDYLARNP